MTTYSAQPVVKTSGASVRAKDSFLSLRCKHREHAAASRASLILGGLASSYSTAFLRAINAGIEMRPFDIEICFAHWADSSFPIMAQRHMQSGVFSRRKNAQVFKAVVSRIAVNMMDMFVGAKWAANQFTHHLAICLLSTRGRSGSTFANGNICADAITISCIPEAFTGLRHFCYLLRRLFLSFEAASFVAPVNTEHDKPMANRSAMYAKLVRDLLERLGCVLFYEPLLIVKAVVFHPDIILRREEVSI
jgi:hypothetical protein